MAESHKQKMDEARPGPAQHRPGKLRIPILIGAVVFGIAVAAGVYLWSGGRGEARHAYALAPESALPDNIRKAPPKVREAYRFAIANRDNPAPDPLLSAAAGPSTRVMPNATSKKSNPTGKSYLTL